MSGKNNKMYLKTKVDVEAVRIKKLTIYIKKENNNNQPTNQTNKQTEAHGCAWRGGGVTFHKTSRSAPHNEGKSTHGIYETPTGMCHMHQEE